MRANTCWVMPLSCELADVRRPWNANAADARRCPTGESAASWPGGSRAASSFLDDAGLGRDDLLATVVAVGGHVVAQVRLARGGVGRQLLGGQRVVRTAHAALGRGN